MARLDSFHIVDACPCRAAHSLLKSEVGDRVSVLYRLITFGNYKTIDSYKGFVISSEITKPLIFIRVSANSVFELTGNLTFYCGRDDMGLREYGIADSFCELCKMQNVLL